jgi:hypothetical protein
MIETLYTPFGTLTDHYGEQGEQEEQGEREQGERERHNSQQHNTPTQFQNRTTHKRNHHHHLTFKGGRSTE